MSSMQHGEKSQLLAKFDEARREMCSVLERVDPGQEIYPGWNIKENIAHITGWEDVTLKALQAYLAGGKAYLLPVQGIDAHNEDMIALRAALSFEKVLREWEETREALKGVIMRLSEQDLEARIAFPWGLQGSIKDMLAIIADHEKDHAHELNPTVSS
jgi:DinB superfamily